MIAESNEASLSVLEPLTFVDISRLLDTPRYLLLQGSGGNKPVFAPASLVRIRQIIDELIDARLIRCEQM
ncbi:hypothetical protein CY652_07800 [Burkholderia sp. WAC0059]|nr:hypothetical protein CY652_07800 [Burkholderia sp. WAC0059]